jgi:hypothetical protein
MYWKKKCRWLKGLLPPKKIATAVFIIKSQEGYLPNGVPVPCTLWPESKRHWNTVTAFITALAFSSDFSKYIFLSLPPLLFF